MAATELVQVTYREIAERFGIGVEGARIKAKRRAAKGEWRLIPGNHPQDVVRIELPAEEFRLGTNKPLRSPLQIPNEGSPTDGSQQETQRRDTNDLETLVEIVSQLTAQSQSITERLIEAERRKAEADRDTAISQAENQNLRARLAEVQESHLAELKGLQERFGGDADQARLALAEWKARPWWRRMVG